MACIKLLGAWNSYCTIVDAIESGSGPGQAAAGWSMGLFSLGTAWRDSGDYLSKAALGAMPGSILDDVRRCDLAVQEQTNDMDGAGRDVSQWTTVMSLRSKAMSAFASGLEAAAVLSGPRKPEEVEAVRAWAVALDRRAASARAGCLSAISDTSVSIDARRDRALAAADSILDGYNHRVFSIETEWKGRRDSAGRHTHRAVFPDGGLHHGICGPGPVGELPDRIDKLRSYLLDYELTDALEVADSLCDITTRMRSASEACSAFDREGWFVLPPIGEYVPSPGP